MRTVGISLVADSSKFTRELKVAANATERLVDQIGKAGSRASVFNKAQADAARLATQHRNLQAAMGQTGKVAQTSSGQVVASAGKMSSAFNDVMRTATGFTIGMAAVAGIQRTFQFATSAVIGFNSKLQNANIGFTTMLGSAGKATALLDQLRRFAVQTPFEFPDLLQAAKRLLALGFTADKIIPTLTSVGNAVAGLDSGTEGVQRITLALGQMQSATRVNARDMLQLTEAGIPAWQILADKMHLSVREVRNLSEKGLLPAAKAIPMLLQGMEDRFGGLMDKMAHTWSGALSNIKDASVQFIAAGARPFFNALAGGADALSQHLQSKEFQAWITRVGEAGARALPILRDAFMRLGPAAGAFMRTIGNLGRLFIGVAQDVRPVVSALISIGGGAVIAGLTVLAKALESVSGFLEKNRTLAEAGAVIFIASLVPAIWSAVAGFTAMAASGLTTFLARTILMAGNAAAAFTMMSVSMQAAMGIAGVAALGLGAALVYVNQQESKFARGSVEDAKSKAKGFQDTTKQLNILIEKYNTALDVLNSFSNVEKIANLKEYGKAKDAVDKLGKGVEALSGTREAQRQSLLQEQRDLGLSTNAITKLSQASDEFSEEYVKALAATTQQTSLTSDQIFNMFGMNAEKVKEFGKAVEEAMNATRQSFSSDADLITNVGSALAQANSEGEQSVKAHAAATEKLSGAQRRLSQLQARQRVDSKRTISDEQALANARDAVAAATQDVAQTSGEAVSAGQLITDFYRNATRDAQDFTANINQAIQRGLDPQLVSRMIQAGPKAAGPILQAILSDHSGRMLQMVNDSEKALAQVSTNAVLQARLMAIATSKDTPVEISKMIKTAMEIQNRQLVENGRLTAAQLAEAMKLTPEEVQKVADSYQIPLAAPALPPVEPNKYFQSDEYKRISDKRMERNLTRGYARGAVVRNKSAGPVVWNEPQAGGESYIPHSPSKRGRSVQILHHTARILGVRHFADGGMTLPRSPMGNYRPNEWGGKKTVQYVFTGDIQGVKMEDAQLYAERKARLTALAGER